MLFMVCMCMYKCECVLLEFNAILVLFLKQSNKW